MTRWLGGMGARGWRRRSHSRVPIWERVGVGNGNRRWNKGFSVPRKTRSQRLSHRRESNVFPHFPRFPAFPYYVGCTSKEVHPRVGGRTAGTQWPSSPSAYRCFPTICSGVRAVFLATPGAAPARIRGPHISNECSDCAFYEGTIKAGRFRSSAVLTRPSAQSSSQHPWRRNCLAAELP